MQASTTHIRVGQVLTIGLAGGVLSGLLGIGGGVIMVPLLVLWASYGQRHAHAISLAAIIPISIVAVIVYGVADRIHYPEAAALAVGSIVGARIGAGALARAPERLLKGAFGCFLIVIAVSIGAG